MIGLAKACSGGGTLGNYVMDKEKGYELDRNLLCGDNPKEIMEEIKSIQELNQRASNKTFSLVLSPDIKDSQKLTNKELKDITRQYMGKLGIDPNKQQFVAFVHTEKKHKHIHIIANRVQTNGKLIPDHHIGKRAQWAAHEIAQERGLTSAKQIMIDNVKSAELQKGNFKSLRKEIFNKHESVIKMNPKGFNEYQKSMEKLGIKVDTVFNKKGIVQGHKLTDKLSGQIFKASEINRHLGLSSLMKPYTPLEPIIKIAKLIGKSNDMGY